MNHYLYKITNSLNGHFYIGIRSCNCDPFEDTSYKGSGVFLKEIDNKFLYKEILTVFSDRSTAIAAEALIVNDHFVNRDDTLNMRTGGERGGGEKFASRQLEGITKAKERGVYTGRKPEIDHTEIKKLRDSGMGATAIARQMSIERTSVYRLMKKHYG